MTPPDPRESSRDRALREFGYRFQFAAGVLFGAATFALGGWVAAGGFAAILLVTAVGMLMHSAWKDTRDRLNAASRY